MKESGNDTVARTCCLYPPANLPRGRHFFQANEGKVIPIIIVITPLIVFVTESQEMNFWLFSRRIHFNNLNNIQIPVCFAFSFHFLHFFLTELTEFFHKTQWKTWHSLRSIANVSLWWWNVIPLRTVCSIHSMKWSLKSKCPHLWAMSLICLKIYRFFSLLQ